MTQRQIEDDIVPVQDINVAVIDLPGGVKGNGYQCPNCSLTHIDWDNEKDESVKVPDECGRCGCPMDTELGKVFTNEHSRLTPKARLESTVAAEAVAEANAILAKADEARRAAEAALAAVKESQAEPVKAGK